MRTQQRWIRQQLICCFIYSYTQAHQFPPTVREIGAWMGCPGMRSLQLALADLEQQQYLTRDPRRRRSIVLSARRERRSHTSYEAVRRVLNASRENLLASQDEPAAPYSEDAEEACSKE